VFVEGISEPIVASRSEGAIARDVAVALGSRRVRGLREELEESGQEPLF
jgi:hypothetical protein